MTTITKNIFMLLFVSLLLSACTVQPLNRPQTEGNNTAPEAAKEQNMNTSLRELMAKGNNVQCNYSFIDPETKISSKGVMYLSGEKFAQETEIVVPPEGSAVGGKMNMISDGTNIYTWNPDKKDSGMKFPIEKTEGSDSSVQNGKIDYDQKMDMICTPWAVNQSKFSVPGDVNFTDLSDMMKNIPSMPSGIPTMPVE